MQYILKMFILATILASSLVRAEDAYLALTIITPNEVEVYVDGTLNSKYSDATVIPIAPGPHRISFKGNGYQTEDWDISPRDGATLSKDVKLVPIVIRDGGGGSDLTLTKLVVKLSAQVQALQQRVEELKSTTSHKGNNAEVSAQVQALQQQSDAANNELRQQLESKINLLSTGLQLQLKCVTISTNGQFAYCPAGYIATGCTAGMNRGSYDIEDDHCRTHTDVDWTRARCCAVTK